MYFNVFEGVFVKWSSLLDTEVLSTCRCRDWPLRFFRVLFVCRILTCDSKISTGVLLSVRIRDSLHLSPLWDHRRWTSSSVATVLGDPSDTSGSWVPDLCKEDCHDSFRSTPPFLSRSDKSFEGFLRFGRESVPCIVLLQLGDGQSFLSSTS